MTDAVTKEYHDGSQRGSSHPLSYALRRLSWYFFIFFFAVVLLAIITRGGYPIMDWYVSEGGATAPLDSVLELGVSCGSNSMLPVIRCGDVLLVREWRAEWEPVIGEVYVYERANASDLLVHRLISCQNPSCGVLVFKGDNNRVPDLPVPRGMVRYWVRGVLFGILP